MVKHSVLKGFYELDRTIGCGGFAKVKLATHLATGERVAIKIMDKAMLKDDLPRVKLELKALKTLAHEHICKLYQVIETETHYFIVVEYCSGGELFDHIVEKNRLTEKESRIFFRQIVSAVAYLHSLGYAHRDLKPENVLLDHAQNLKLIDFGLCARPEGGVQSPLYTSCGSPTYAAPELVLGQQYLGPEVDVWAMGVLLYALLAGFLPFDDQNIDSLYKKILSGRYEEPSFMSSSSKKLIRQMLQTDPKKRITVKELLTHPWLAQGHAEPIKVVEQKGKSQDEDVVALMAQYHNSNREDMWRHLRRWRYDYDTATYLLLLQRKKRGLPLQLLSGAIKLPIRIRSADTISRDHLTLNVPQKQINKSDHIPSSIPKPAKAIPTTPTTPSSHLTPMIKVLIEDRSGDYSDNENVFYHNVSELLSPGGFIEPRKPTSIRKPLKRIRSPNMDGDCSPVPAKRVPMEHLTPKTPERKVISANTEGSSVSARKVLGSIERSLNRVKHVLTPRKQSEANQGPVTLANKDLCNVSTTQCTDPEFVITELSKALQKKGIHCERKGVLKGFYELDRTIGCGGFAKVKLATHLATGERVAIKIMDKAMLKDDLPRVKLELKALKTLAHEHICKLYQVIETETHYFIVVEYCSGGELFDHIVEKNRLTEKESRIFFRQIVSAVAYLHSLGYAHRDLKPENVLLDHAQNLKLIDFGLCARPEGGVQSPLYTSCGSPTYAAPELVLGQQYLGPEVDVWAMGVLLYALLAGFLPFDDQNIDSLYKKILSGRYEEPSFMSSTSKKLIRQMLQTDPKKRITVKELLTHPWLTQGHAEPIKVVEQKGKSQDEDIVALMAQYHNSNREDMWRHLRRWRYDYDTATYLLLLQRKKRGLPLQMLSGAIKLPIRIRSADTISRDHLTLNVPQKQINKSDHIPSSIPKPAKAIPTTPTTPSSHLTPMIKVLIEDRSGDYSDNENVFYHNVSELLSPGGFIEPRKPTSIRKPLKRIRSPNMDGDCSPVPAKRVPMEHLTPKTPERKVISANTEGSSVSARKVLGSIERSLNRVKHVLTPRKQSEANQGPVTLANKDLCNVSTTQCTDPEFVITELSKALQKKGIHCERKGFTIRGKMDPNVVSRYGGCSFELEICYLPNLGGNPKPSQSGNTPTKSSTPSKSVKTQGRSTTPSKSVKTQCRSTTPSKSTRIPVKTGTPTASKIPTKVNRKSGEFDIQRASDNKVGIRRKRLKGDSWCYKKVCEQVLALTATELRLESAV